MNFKVVGSLNNVDLLSYFHFFITMADLGCNICFIIKKQIV